MPANLGTIFYTSAGVGDHTLQATTTAFTIRGSDAVTTVDFGNGAALVGTAWFNIMQNPNYGGKIITIAGSNCFVLEFLGQRT